MKQKFSTQWVASKQKRKQRKYIFNAPLHKRQKLISSSLSKELRRKYGKRNMAVKKGDLVRILVGKFKRKEGKVSSVRRDVLKVTVDGMQIQKKDGTKVNAKFHPSNLQIKELNLTDKKREAILLRKKKGEKENAPEKKQ